MEPVKSEIEIQAVNLIQQWYSLPHDRLPDLDHLLSEYLHCFSDTADRRLFLEEALRLAREMEHSPKAGTLPPRYNSLLQEALSQRLSS